MIGVEGGNQIDDSLSVLRAYHELGAGYLTLTHSRTIEWADSATDNPRHDGLTPFGEAVVHELNRIGMLVDLSHVSERTMRDALRVSKAPVIFSHSSARALDDHPRDVSDDVLKLVAANGGVVMVNFAPAYLSDAYRRWSAEAAAEGTRLNAPPFGGLYIGQPDKAAAALAEWKRQHPAPRVTLSDVADHIEHIAKVAGVDHVGIGSDFDGVDNVLPEGLARRRHLSGAARRADAARLERRRHRQASRRQCAARDGARRGGGGIDEKRAARHRERSRARYRHRKTRDPIACYRIGSSFRSSALEGGCVGR